MLESCEKESTIMDNFVEMLRPIWVNSEFLCKAWKDVVFLMRQKNNKTMICPLIRGLNYSLH